MAVHISINGNAAGDGFLLEPLDDNYEFDIKLWTDTGTENVTLQASPNPTGLVFSATGPFSISTAQTSVATVHATTQSASRGDTIIQVLDGTSAVVASFAVTSLRHPVINFGGRFEARFSTDGAQYNANPKYTNVIDNPVPPGWTWILEGEPDFVPAAGNVPVRLDTTGVGRVIRLNNPISLRSHVPPVVSTVRSISGDTSSGTETFFAGDPLIGQPVDFGPHTYFAGNQPNSGAATEEYWQAQREPMALFEIHFGNPSLYFRGASYVSDYTHMATFVNEQTRTEDTRPKTPGVVGAAAWRAEIGLPSMVAYSETRIDLLIAEYIPLPAGTQKRNLARRIGHLLSAVSAAKRASVQAAHPGAFTIRPGNITWDGEIYNGRVKTDLHALSGGSSVIEYLRQFFEFEVEWKPFAFHSDELCGYHKGTFSGDMLLTGNDIGDPHTRTVNGVNYDFQAAGEFTLLQDGNNMEIQVRQTPVATANPVTDSYSGLTACVSVITAVAARVGKHRIALQPGGREAKQLQFYLDGKPVNLPAAGINLGGSRVTPLDNGETGLRIDYDNQTVLVVTSHFWNSNNIWYLNVNVPATKAIHGLMGYVPKKSWLPRLRNGIDTGPKPASLHDRYITLYKTFADSWRVTEKTSLFVYEQGASTQTFTDTNWPAEQAPCTMKPGLGIPGAVILQGMPVNKAALACKMVTDEDLHKHCVFDVATTGDETFVQGYMATQALRRSGTSVKITIHEAPANPNRSQEMEADKPPVQSFFVLATVSSLNGRKPVTEGSVIFYVNDKAAGEAVKLETNGTAKWKINGLDKGEYTIRAGYIPDDKTVNQPSGSANLNFSVTTAIKEQTGGNGINKGCLAQPWYIWLLLILVILLILWFTMIR